MAEEADVIDVSEEERVTMRNRSASQESKVLDKGLNMGRSPANGFN